MDSSRTEALVGTGLVIAASFVMGMLGAQAMIDRIEARRAREAAAVDREFDQLQEDVDDLTARLRAIEGRLDRIEEIVEAIPIPAAEDPS
jgi:uncharacterized protein YlxW (UPF0749 family)